MSIRRLHYLVTLAEEGHFGRAAEKCNISQPTLSSSIRQFEIELGVQIVQRGHRFTGLTQEGQRVLEYAKRVLSEKEKLFEEMSLMRTGLAGKLRIGVIPTALPLSALITSNFVKEHRGVTIEVVTNSAQDILVGLEDYSLDLGISYLDEAKSPKIKELNLYNENLALLTPARGPFGSRNVVTWTEIAQTPLVLLSRDMQNRRVIDKTFDDLGCQVQPQIESNSLINLAAHVRSGAWSAIVPGESFAFCSTPPDTKLVKLSEPDISQMIGLQMTNSERPSVVTKNFFESAIHLDLESVF